MAQKAPSKKRAGKRAAAPAVDEKVLIEMYRNIYATRQFELKCSELYRAGFIRGYLHPYLGEEAIAAMIMEEAYDDLDGPVMRICGKNTTIPYNLELEKVCVPSVEDIIEGVLEMV